MPLTRPDGSAHPASRLDLRLGDGSSGGQSDHGDETNEGGGELHFGDE
jgi:hypothetical protein